jgi:DNA-binding response OmpR family regulator
LGLLKENGYELLTATNGPDALRLFMSGPVDAVVIEHRTGVLDASLIATEIKRVRPMVPIVMLVDHLELPEGTLASADALVAKSDGPHFLWATVHFVLNVKPVQRREHEMRAQLPSHLRRPSRSHGRASHGRSGFSQIADDNKQSHFSPGVWRGIRDGTIRF